MSDTPIFIRKLSMNPRGGVESVEEVLKKVYVESEFIDPLEDIVRKIPLKDEGAPCIPHGVYASGEAVGFFSIESENPLVGSRFNKKTSCWLESFFISSRCQGKGYAGEVLRRLPDLIEKDYPFRKEICLTVNFRNTIAKSLYLKHGFHDTGETCLEGPAGPQHIYRLSLHRRPAAR